MGENMTNIEAEALKQMRERGGRWCAYQNQDMSSASAGHVQFLQYGEDKTHKVPPPKMPDTVHGLGWRYQNIGFVDLASGEIVKEESPCISS